ncbi:MAG: hypothetical protein U1A73_04545 [Pseudomonas sp.]|nr:hypothetical protein [Pseudomonas sp.]
MKALRMARLIVVDEGELGELEAWQPEVAVERVAALEVDLAAAKTLLQAYFEQHTCLGEKARCDECTRTRALLGEVKP